MKLQDPDLAARQQSSPHRKSVSRRVLKGGVSVASYKIAGIGAALVSNIALARAISPEEFGVFLLLVSIINLGTIFGLAGLDRAVVIFIARSLAGADASGARDALKKGQHIGATASLLTASVIFGLMYFGGNAVFNLPNAISLTSSVAVGVLFTARLNLLAESLRGYHDLVFCSLFESQSGGLLLNIVFFFLLIAAGLTGSLNIHVAIWMFVISCGILIPLAQLRLLSVANRHQDTVLNLEDTRQVVTYDAMLALCLPLMLSQLLNFASTRSDIWIAAAFCSHDDVAIFGAARRLVFMLSMPLSIVNLSVLSSIPELHSQNRIAELQHLLRLTSTIAAIPAIVLLLPLILLPGPILEWVYGPFYAAGSTVLIILCSGQLVATLTGSCGTCMLMTGHHRSVIFANLAAGCLMLSAGAIAATHLGVIGLATVCAITLAGKNLSFLIMARAQIGVWTHATIPRNVSYVRDVLKRLKS